MCIYCNDGSTSDTKTCRCQCDREPEPCEECDDTGYLDISDCCGAELLGDSSDYICKDCGEHCEAQKCDCGGER